MTFFLINALNFICGTGGEKPVDCGKITGIKTNGVFYNTRQRHSPTHIHIYIHTHICTHWYGGRQASLLRFAMAQLLTDPRCRPIRGFNINWMPHRTLVLYLVSLMAKVAVDFTSESLVIVRSLLTVILVKMDWIDGLIPFQKAWGQIRKQTMS